MRVNFVCETCGRSGSRCYAQNQLPSHFFCSRECQNEWQKTREDIVAKNKDPEFRKKVSEGLKRRKKRLGDNYHSPETKKKIGRTTVEHWESYDDEKRQHMLDVLHQNSEKMRSYGPYDADWHRLSKKIRSGNICHRCGKKDNLVVHHIIPVSQGGGRSMGNLVPLCIGCHSIVEWQQKRIFEIIPDWEVVRVLVKVGLHCV